MADIVLGVGTSHSPLMIISSDKWEQRSKDDHNMRLNTLDGRYRSYTELAAERGERYRDESNPQRFPEIAQRAEDALDWLSASIADAKPDVILVVGDDQEELFGPDNQPAIAVFHGPEVIMKPAEHAEKAPPWLRKYYGGYWMDLPHRYPGAPELGYELTTGLCRRGVDVTSMASIKDPTKSGFGHAFGFVIQRLMRRAAIPMLPVVVNDYFPPNQPSPARCYHIGRVIGETVRSSSLDLRVCVVASGGLSHFLCEEEFDRNLLYALKTQDSETLIRIPEDGLISGTSEVRNWITIAGMLPEASFEYRYLPVRRTPLGTGIGLGFAVWSKP